MIHEQWATKFWKRVSKTDNTSDCWTWTGARLPTGYGCFYPAMFIDGKRKTLYAHRVSWEMANDRQVPPGLDIMHACDNPPCVNPTHLSPGTRKENELDKWNKGRGRPPPPQSGEKHWYSKLTEQQVVEIRAEYKAGGTTHQAIADRLGVSKTVVGLIIRRKAWKHI